MRDDEDFVGGYLDQWQLAVEIVESPIALPGEAWVLAMPATTWSPDEVTGALRALVEEGDLQGHPYDLTFRRNVLSWGADAAAEEIILKLAQWAGAGVTADLAIRAIRQFLDRVASTAPGEFGDALPLGADEARERAEWAVRERFALPPAHDILEDPSTESGFREVIDTSIELIDETHNADGAWVFGWRANDGTRFFAEIRRSDRYAELIWVRRIADGGDGT